MTNAIFNNAYGVLGLLPNATQNEIKRRVKELEKRLQIDEVPSFEYDFGIFNTLRNEKGIKAANDELSSIQRQILHSFFRVYVNSENHAQTLKTLTKSGEGIREFYDSKDSWDFISKKNFAIALSLYMCEYDTEDFCLKLWDELLNSQNHLLTFQKIFLNDDELNVSETHFDGLRERLINELSRVFSEVADKTGEESVLAKFIKKFGTQNLDENIGKESFDELKKALGILEKLNISADGVYDDDEKAIIKKCLKMFENGFEKLKNLGLYDSSKCLQIRDLAVKKIRTQSLDLHNNLSQSEESLKLTEFAMKISASQGSKSQLEQDFEALKRQIKGKESQGLVSMVAEIMEDFERLENDFSDYKFRRVKQKIQDLMEKDKEKQLLQEVAMGVNIYDTFAIRFHSIATYNLINHNKFTDAKNILSYALEITNHSAIRNKIKNDLNKAMENIKRTSTSKKTTRTITPKQTSSQTTTTKTNNFLAVFISLAVAIIFLMFFDIFKPYQTSQTSQTTTIDEIRNRGFIRIGVSANNPPFSWIDKGGVNRGYDVYFARRIATELLVSENKPRYVRGGDWHSISASLLGENKIQFVLVESYQRIDYLNAGKVDIVLANFTITPERARLVDFTEPYMKVSLGLVAPKNSKITNLKGLKGKKIIVNKGTKADAYFTKNQKSLGVAKILRYENNSEAFNALKKRRGDALAHDNILLFSWVKKNVGFKVVVSEFGEKDYIAVAVAKGNLALSAFINGLMVKLRDEKFFYEAYDFSLKYNFPSNIRPENVIFW